jgi:hypothetical protein
MFTYFIPLTVNLTKNSKLEKFVHELNALWKLSGSSMGALRELVAVAGIFGNREFYNKLLCILVFMHQRVYGKESLVQTQILKIFKQLDNEVVIDHLKRHFKPTHPLSFDHWFSINDDMTVHCTKIRPI